MTNTNAIQFSDETINAMREWAKDCQWRDSDDIDDMTADEIIKGVARHYDGGIAAFLQDAQLVSV